jgi:hypothetical protein
MKARQASMLTQFYQPSNHYKGIPVLGLSATKKGCSVIGEEPDIFNVVGLVTRY